MSRYLLDKDFEVVYVVVRDKFYILDVTGSVYCDTDRIEYEMKAASYDFEQDAEGVYLVEVNRVTDWGGVDDFYFSEPKKLFSVSDYYINRFLDDWHGDDIMISGKLAPKRLIRKNEKIPEEAYYVRRGRKSKYIEDVTTGKKYPALHITPLTFLTQSRLEPKDTYNYLVKMSSIMLYKHEIDKIISMVEKEKTAEEILQWWNEECDGR